MDRMLKRAKRNNKRRGPAQRRGLAAVLAGRGDLPLLPPRRLAALGQLGPTPLLPARDGGGAARPPPHALQAQAAGGRLGLGAAHGPSPTAPS